MTSAEKAASAIVMVPSLLKTLVLVGEYRYPRVAEDDKSTPELIKRAETFSTRLKNPGDNAEVPETNWQTYKSSQKAVSQGLIKGDEEVGGPTMRRLLPHSSFAFGRASPDKNSLSNVVGRSCNPS